MSLCPLDPYVIMGLKVNEVGNVVPALSHCMYFCVPHSRTDKIIVQRQYFALSTVYFRRRISPTETNDSSVPGMALLQPRTDSTYSKYRESTGYQQVHTKRQKLFGKCRSCTIFAENKFF